MSAVANLIRGSVDYAGLFPPAKLPLDQVLTNYQTYLNNNRHQMLGRLVLPTAKLQEADSFAKSLSPQTNSTWLISALVAPVAIDGTDLDSTSLEESIHTIAMCNQRNGSPYLKVDAVEIRTASPEATRIASNLIPDDISVFLKSTGAVTQQRTSLRSSHWIKTDGSQKYEQVA